MSKFFLTAREPMKHFWVTSVIMSIFFKELARRGKIGQLAREFFLAPAHSRLSYKDIVKYSFYFGLPWVRKMSAVRKANPFLQKDFAGFGAGSRDFMTSQRYRFVAKKRDL